MSEADARLQRRIEQEQGNSPGHVADERDQMFSDMGYGSYEDYLRSRLWSSIRSTVLAANPRCVACSKKASHIHHLSYSRAALEGSNDDLLKPLCEACHRRVEFTDNGNRRTIKDAKAAFAQLTKKTRKKRKQS